MNHTGCSTFSFALLCLILNHSILLSLLDGSFWGVSGLFYCISEGSMEVSDRFISAVLISLQRRFGVMGQGCRTTDRLRSVQLKQTGLLLVWHSQRSPFSSFTSSPPWLHCFYSFQFPPFLVSGFKSRSCTHHQSMKVNTSRDIPKADWQLWVV